MKNKYYTALIAFSLAFLMACERDIAFELPQPFILAIDVADQVSQEPGFGIFQEFEMQSASGLKRLEISLNGEAYDQIDYNAELTFRYELNYTIPGDQEIGSFVDFNLRMLDMDDREATYLFRILVLATFSENIEQINDETEVVRIKGRLNGSYTFFAENKYLIDSTFSIEDSGTLIIEPGTEVYFKTFPEPTKLSRLVIARGSKIMAEGSAEEPILFTSDKVLLGETPSPDDWGGIFIFGNSPTNQGSVIQDQGFRYGGNVPGENSGILKYARIEYAGKNGNHALYCFGVGSQTTIEYVQVYRNENIAFRVRGGRVSFKYIAAIGHGGYGIWAEHGWQGNGQFWIFQTDRQATLVPINFWNQARSIEMRNDESNFMLAPRTQFRISNVTLIGNGYIDGQITGTRRGVRIRRGSIGILQNMLVTEFPDDATRIEDLAISELESGAMLLDNTRSFNNRINFGQDAESFFFESGNFNVTNTSTAGISTTNFVGSENSTFNPVNLGAFFSSAPYIGAVESEASDWTSTGNWFKDLNGNIR